MEYRSIDALTVHIRDSGTIVLNATAGAARRHSTAEKPIFSNQEVQAALAWKYGRLVGLIFVESVWPLLDEYRAHLARAHGKEGAP